MPLTWLERLGPLRVAGSGAGPGPGVGAGGARAVGPVQGPGSNIPMPAPVDRSRGAATPPVESSGTVAFSSPAGGNAQFLYLIDTRARAFAVYRVDPSNPKGTVKLEAARQYQWDLKLSEYNNLPPEVAAIESTVKSLGQPESIDRGTGTCSLAAPVLPARSPRQANPTAAEAGGGFDTARSTSRWPSSIPSKRPPASWG